MNRPAFRYVVTVVGSMLGASLPRRSLCGIVGAGLLFASGGIHLDLYLTGYRTIPTIGWLFLLQTIAALALGGVVLAAAWLPDPVASPIAASGALFALATLGGYLLSVWVGLFGFREVRTTAGIVAGVIDVAVFAVLAVMTFLTRPRFLKIPFAPSVSLVTVVAIALLVVGAATAKSGTGPSSASGSGQELRTGTVSGVTVVTDNKGLTLYWFAPDTSTASKCTGSCAVYWPPVYGKPTAGPGVTGTLGTITRPDGTTQATYDGHPLYTYISDSRPGLASGNNLNLNGGFWHEVTVTG